MTSQPAKSSKYRTGGWGCEWQEIRTRGEDESGKECKPRDAGEGAKRDMTGGRRKLGAKKWKGIKGQDITTTWCRKGRFSRVQQEFGESGTGEGE